MNKATTSISLEQLLPRLDQLYPNPRYELDWETPLQLLLATILAAQCTDERVNKVTKVLFPKYPNARAIVEADLAELETVIKATGAYRQKAQLLRGACKALLERFDGEVPRTMEALITLPGVARKTANVVLNTAWNLPSGVIVDTHVARVSPRMGLAKQSKPEAIERELMALVPQERWTRFGPAMVLHGRRVCTARAPKCAQCAFTDLCPKLGLGAEDGSEDDAS